MSGYYNFKITEDKREDTYVGLVKRGDKLIGDVSSMFPPFNIHLILLKITKK
jgi:hypothetical protein